ncbi:PHP domain-containing protein [Alkalicoccus saliphilus]|uniref:PHP domain-containing protein n=1 Tax=Alkalicoccus saliphilus TaxID=200989 RepID=A0A2T4U7Y6_9BACI|nr:PHP domain-containing protein [Alkalicoccus saliphilus]PTL39492.1 PHP domain-containing protein [Alkalicoccus saliphilus]
MSRADLHMHSTISDGGYTPSELMKKCAEAGVKMISLTDHDSTDGLQEAAQAAASLGMKFINGIELSTRVKGRSVDILGYGIDSRSQNLQEKLQFHREKRYNRMKQMVEKCQSIGLAVSIADVEKEVTGVTWSRPHLAGALVKKGYAESVSEVFEKFIGYGRPCYVEKEEEMQPEEAVNIIREAGGAAIAAHPVYYNLDEQILNWLERGQLDGVEVYHRDHSPKDIKRFLLLVEKAEVKTGKRFYRTGGTDFHHEKFGRSGERIGASPLPWKEAEYICRGIGG